jgi:hypothetical protein
VSEPRIVLVDRDIRTRPRLTWRQAWATSRNSALSTISLLSYARETVEYGGLRAIAPPVIASIVLTAVFLGIAFGAAMLAGAAQGSTRRAALILLASVVLSQVLTFTENRRLARRLFIVANDRVVATPGGWAIAFLQVSAKTAPRAKGALLGDVFRHVEVTYYRDAKDAEIAAYYRRGKATPEGQPTTEGAEHAEVLLAAALGDMPYVLRSVTLN